MKNQTLITVTDQKLIKAGLKARVLRQQLAVTYLASQEIIDAMRALRQGIPDPEKIKQSLLPLSSVAELPLDDDSEKPL